MKYTEESIIGILFKYYDGKSFFVIEDWNSGMLVYNRADEEPRSKNRWFSLNNINEFIEFGYWIPEIEQEVSFPIFN